MTDVLKNKREITRLQILVEVAENQPAVSQKEVADAIVFAATRERSSLSEIDITRRDKFADSF